MAKRRFEEDVDVNSIVGEGRVRWGGWVRWGGGLVEKTTKAAMLIF